MLAFCAAWPRRPEGSRSPCTSEQAACGWHTCHGRVRKRIGSAWSVSGSLPSAAPPRLRRGPAHCSWNGNRQLSSLNLLQSGGRSLHLPLPQNGACPFPSTPLLSVLMLVTHTVREIVPILPLLRIVAVSVQRLQIRRACIAAIAVDMINVNPIIIVNWLRVLHILLTSCSI